MILSVTLNPCLDKTLTVPPWRPGDNVRGTAVRHVVGGKGNNVARALTRLGRTARPATFLGGPVGKLCEELLRGADQLDPLVVSTAAATRTILTIRTEGTDDQTAFFDPDPTVTADEADRLYRALDEAMAAGVELLTLSGSSPGETTHHLYSDLIALARSRRIPVFLDTYGPALRAVWGFWPEVVQLNRREAAGYLEKPGPLSDDDVFGLLGDWARHGVQIGIVTDGPGPVLIQARGERYRVRPPTVTAINPIGSGDCLLAGLADGWLAGMETTALLRHGIGCAVANALTWDAGALDPLEASRIETELELESLGPVETNGTVVPLIRKTLSKKR